MREVNFVRGVVYGMAHLLGVDPEQDLLKDHARAWVSSINSHVRRGWRFWNWPEFQVTEERAFRQVWDDSVAYESGQGDESEVYYSSGDAYYRITTDAAAGTLPTNTSYWELIESDDLDRHLAYAQSGKEDIDRVIGIDNANPRPTGESWRWPINPSSRGLDLGSYTGNTVWVTYIPRAPEFTTTTYDTTRTYARGDLVLDLDNGDCYRALRTSSNEALGSATYWLKQKFPYALSDYVRYAAAAEQADDIQLRADLNQTADERLKDEVDNLIAQGQVSFYGRNISIPPKPLGITQDYYRAYWGSVLTA